MPKGGWARHLWWVVAVAALVVGLVTGRFITSPAERALSAAAPPRTTLTDQVRSSVVSQTVSVGGSLTPGNVTNVDLSGNSGDSQGFITGVRVAIGQQVNAGTVLIEVSGRPVIVLPGAIPAYRTLTPGVAGPDVAQLQEALRTLGLLQGSEDSYGARTQAAVATLYTRVGFTPARTPITELDSALDNQRSAEQSAESAQEARDQAHVTLQRAQRPAVGSDSTAQQSRLDAIADARRALESANRTLERARTALRAAQDKVTAARAATGVLLPRDEVVYAPSVPATVAQLPAAVGRPASGTALVLTSGDLVAAARALVPATVTGVTAEMPATITTPDGTLHEAVIASIRTTTNSAVQGQPDQEPRTDMIVRPKAPIPAVGNGADDQVRITVSLQRSASPVLNVAIGAVVSDAQGAASVQVRQPDGTFRRVPVTTGIQGDGRVEVRGDLASGDEVLLGPSTEASPPTSAGQRNS